uniref:NTR domain-containing protein n=1 Tax=Steinernema glaseri TaxID=37863 RepID=A0A1I7YRL6_9BILA
MRSYSHIYINYIPRRLYSYSSIVDNSLYIPSSTRNDYVNFPCAESSYSSDADLPSRYYDDEDDECALMLDLSVAENVKPAYSSGHSSRTYSKQTIRSTQSSRVVASRAKEAPALRTAVSDPTHLQSVSKHRHSPGSSKRSSKRSSTLSEHYDIIGATRRNIAVKGELDHTYVNIKWAKKDKRLRRFVKMMKDCPIAHVMASIRKLF